MALFEIALATMMAQAPAMASAHVAQDALLEGRNHAAIEQIESNSELDADDPARLINLGIARARTGDYDAARALFQAVIAHKERVELETAEGDWVDSRRLARKAISMLDRGEFERYFALSLR
ncbi:hypothetical protein [Qipengyuania sp. DGS5-3]|uniref:hypothetical protein n=1 Tax=Qipengyuania sp. DGS5-3 TaxID=3349632 RepID=UPI0036D35683